MLHWEPGCGMGPHGEQEENPRSPGVPEGHVLDSTGSVPRSRCAFSAPQKVHS